MGKARDIYVEVFRVIDKVKEEFENVRVQESEADRRVAEIYHVIERGLESDIAKIDVMDELHEALTSRREIKGERSRLNAMVSALSGVQRELSEAYEKADAKHRDVAAMFKK